MIPLIAGAQAATTGASAITEAIKALYGVAKDINGFIDSHISEMKDSSNPTIARTGRVLEGAKYGFGIGFITPIAIIATGQLLLGNPLAVITTAATAMTLTNPIAMTCAAIGAIYYGWGALTDEEQGEALDKLSKGLNIGIELMQAMIRFVINTMKDLFSSKNIDEIKAYIGSAAEVFGKSVGDITHKVADVVSDSFVSIKKKTGEVVDKTVDLATHAPEAAIGTASDAYTSLKNTAADAYDSITNKTRKSESKETETKDDVQ